MVVTVLVIVTVTATVTATTTNVTVKREHMIMGKRYKDSAVWRDTVVTVAPDLDSIAATTEAITEQGRVLSVKNPSGRP